MASSIARINEREIAAGIGDDASWHAQYSGSAYIVASNLDYRLSEGDLLAVFSQCGEIVDLNLLRDRQTGRSRGTAFIAYEDQRSTTLAVDNFNGVTLVDRVLRVDHIMQYRRPKTSTDAGNEGVCETDQDYEARRRMIWDYADPVVNAAAANTAPMKATMNNVNVLEEEVDDDRGVDGGLLQIEAGVSARSVTAVSGVDEDYQLSRVEAIRRARLQRRLQAEAAEAAECDQNQHRRPTARRLN